MPSSHTSPSQQALLQLGSSETSTPVLVGCAAFTGKRPLFSCKVADIAGGHLLGAVTFSSGPVLVR